MVFFKNLRVRRKLLAAMIPLVLMVLAAGIYSSFESKMIDTWYSVLIDNQVKALRSVGEARAHTNRFGLFLFELADETDPDRRQEIDGQLTNVADDFHTAMAAALKQSPERAAKINAATALFQQAEIDARPARGGARRQQCEGVESTAWRREPGTPASARSHHRDHAGFANVY